MPASLTTSALDPLARDAFGFRQVIVAVNDLGKIYGLDSGSGAVIWSRILGLGWAAQFGAQITPVKLFVVQTAADGGFPEIVLVAQRHATDVLFNLLISCYDNLFTFQGLVDTVIFHVNALTGEDTLGKSPAGTVLQGVDLISGPTLGVYQLPGYGKAIIVLDEFRQVRFVQGLPSLCTYLHSQVYVYPETSTNQKAFSNTAGKLNVALRTGDVGQQLTGHKFSTVEHGRAMAFSTWASSFPAGEKILSIVPRPPGPIASLGKVLGNRTTLYKYLNPHISAVTTVSTTVCGVYVLDVAKGNIIYHASITANKSKGRCDLHATLVENWLVYVYWDEEYEWTGQTKGYRLVTVELYEGLSPDDKTRR
jgi:ER membrane protein complex subunit 1